MGELCMEIKAITVNAAALAPERSAQEGRAKEDTEKSLFGPAYRVTISRAVLEENERARKAIGQEDITVEEMEELMGPVRERIASGVYTEVENYRGWGLQILQDALDCKLQHIADDPLRGMEEAKRSMMLSAGDAVFHDAVRGKLEGESGKLEEEVKELIDRRNGTDGVRSAEEDEEKQREEEEKRTEKQGEESLFLA